MIPNRRSNRMIHRWSRGQTARYRYTSCTTRHLSAFHPPSMHLHWIVVTRSRRCNSRRAWQRGRVPLHVISSYLLTSARQPLQLLRAAVSLNDQHRSILMYVSLDRAVKHSLDIRSPSHPARRIGLCEPGITLHVGTAAAGVIPRSRSCLETYYMCGLADESSPDGATGGFRTRSTESLRPHPRHFTGRINIYIERALRAAQ